MTATYDTLYAEAKTLEIAGRSKMTKAQLEEAITEAKRLDAFADEVFNGLLTAEEEAHIYNDNEGVKVWIEEAPEPSESHAEPLTTHTPIVTALSRQQRTTNYLRQLANLDGYRLTAKQSRRIKKKARHAAKHARTIKAGA